MLVRRYYSNPGWLEEMDRLQSEINRLFKSNLPSRGFGAPSFPALNVWTSTDGAIVTAELPGVHSEDLDISVVAQTLTLKGERKAEPMAEGSHYHRQERGVGHFTRSIELPFPVEAEKVEAVFDKGILSINLPRAESDKPRKILVKSS